MRQQRGKGANRGQRSRREPPDAFAATEYPAEYLPDDAEWPDDSVRASGGRPRHDADWPAGPVGAAGERPLPGKRSARTNISTLPPAPADSRADAQSSGRHHTLIAAHRREASDPRQPVPSPSANHPHTTLADFHPGGRFAGSSGVRYDETDADANGYPAYGDADVAVLPVDREWGDEAETGAFAGPLPPRSSSGGIIFDRETGLLPISLPTLGPGDTPSQSLAALSRGARRNTLQRVTSVTRAAVTGALVLSGLRPRESSATVIPGAAKITVRIPALPGKRARMPRLARPAMLAAGCAALVLTLVLVGVTNQDGLIGPFAQGIWAGHDSVHALPTPIAGWWDAPIASNAPAAPSSTDPAHYVAKYGFDWPSLSGGLSAQERQRLEDMLPFALAATARWDARFGDSLEPQMLLFWTHAEGIGARVNYSNCANEYPPGGYSYFSYITSCDTPSFWQLGYGNQFSVISILKTAFYDMRGDPNDPQAVQKVGQAVLNWDRKEGTSPVCGGYSCAFPAMTIDQIMAGVSLNHWTTDDWWASVLSRDPAINCYMLARALVYFSHNATRTWVGCYYTEPCWSYESNSLGDILVSWNSLRKGAGV